MQEMAWNSAMWEEGLLCPPQGSFLCQNPSGGELFPQYGCCTWNICAQCAGHTLVLALCSGHNECPLMVEDLIVVIPLSWTDHYLIEFRFTRLRGLLK